MRMTVITTIELNFSVNLCHTLAAARSPKLFRNDENAFETVESIGNAF